jgi:pyruvate,water dikinase
VVQGAVDPDEYYVHKPTFRQGHRAVLRRLLGAKQMKLLYSRAGADKSTRDIQTPRADRERFCISDDEVLTLADYAIKIEDHYSEKAGHLCPVDVEWAKDGIDGQLYVVQARPETVVSQQVGGLLEQYSLKATGSVLVTGRAVGTRVATGRARLIRDTS